MSYDKAGCSGTKQEKDRLPTNDADNITSREGRNYSAPRACGYPLAPELPSSRVFTTQPQDVPMESLPSMCFPSSRHMLPFVPSAEDADIGNLSPGAPPAGALPISQIPSQGAQPLFKRVPPQDGGSAKSKGPHSELEDNPGHIFAPVRTEGLGSIGVLPVLPLFKAAKDHPEITFIPREEDCVALWDRYFMPEHIRRHSRTVANLAAAIAREALKVGVRANPDLFFASGLLHDLGKAYCIVHGGNHAQVGAAWVMRETRNGPISQAVRFHVHWPWEEELNEDTLLPLAVIYADKRVMHDGYVTMEERFVDLYERYGTTEKSRGLIDAAKVQGKRIEEALSGLLGVDLDEYIADSRGLVKRA